MIRDNALSDDAFLGGRVMLLQPRQGYRAATDPVLLAAACPARQGDRVLELGCGAGAAILCLAARVGGLAPTGLELQPFYADLARRNARRNGIDLEVVEGDLTAMPAGLRARRFDHVIANPPYHDPAGPASPDPGRDTANRENAPLAGWIDAALRRTEPGGTVSLIHRAERLASILSALERRAGDLRILPLASRRGREAGRVIVRARKASRGPLRLMAPLVLHDGDAHDGDRDDFSSAAQAVLRDGFALQLP